MLAMSSIFLQIDTLSWPSGIEMQGMCRRSIVVMGSCDHSNRGAQQASLFKRFDEFGQVMSQVSQSSNLCRYNNNKHDRVMSQMVTYNHKVEARSQYAS